MHRASPGEQVDHRRSNVSRLQSGAHHQWREIPPGELIDLRFRGKSGHPTDITAMTEFGPDSGILKCDPGCVKE
jgi:hypothetical protein